jgi:hypothetical protein
MSIWKDYVSSAYRVEYHKDLLCAQRARPIRNRETEEATISLLEVHASECRRLGKIIVSIARQED